MINTSNDRCLCCENWLNHWEKYSGQPAVFCSATGCSESFNLEGAHVYELPDRTPKIIPLCSKHNKSDLKFTVLDEVFFAPVETYKQ